jgi:hypothetical protein
MRSLPFSHASAAKIAKPAADNNPHTFTGRMAAWCQDQQAEIAVSLSEMTYVSLGASFWIRGFLSGSEPPPLTAGSSSAEAAWERARSEYRSTGEWPADCDSS